MYAKILMNKGIIKRKIKFSPLDNFCFNIVRINNKEYFLGKGDEYMRGYDEIYSFNKLQLRRVL